MPLLLALCLLACGLAAAEPGTDYLLVPGDSVRISVLDEPDLSMTLPAGPDQTPYPLVGPLAPLAGRSVNAVRLEVRGKLADGYLRDPVVTVTVAEFAPRTAWVVGAVGKPGPVKLDPQRPTSALQAVGEAGGFGEDADRAGARVLRDDPARPGGKMILDLPTGLLPERDLVLMHGDVVVVPRADRVFVLGQVQRPGALPVPTREVMTVSRAVTMAGGFDRFAREGRVNLLRPGAAVVVVDVRSILDGKPNIDDPALRPGDTVFVPESRF